jgi:hypothetical protein
MIQNIKDIATKSVWNDKPPKIKYSCMINTLENGGLKLQDVDSKIKSLKLKWLKAMCDKDVETTWKESINNELGENVSDLLMYNLDEKALRNKNLGDSFYNDMMPIWANIHYTTPLKSDDIAKQILVNNSNIKIGNNPISLKMWPYQNKVRFIKDLLNQDREIAPKEYIETKYNIMIPTMRYNSIISAIPKGWKKTLREDSNVLNYHVFGEHRVILGGLSKKIIEFNTKDLYLHHINEIGKRPTSEGTWEEIVGLGLDEDDWAKVYLHPYKLTRNTKVIAFHFKICHRILACKEKLCIWKIKETDTCERCNKEPDCIEHHLVACSEIRPFWDNLFRWWKATRQMIFPIDTYDILFGLPNPNNDIIIDQLNFTTLQAMYYIYVCNKKDIKPELYYYLLELKSILISIQTNMLSEDREEKFNKLWGEMLDNI